MKNWGIVALLALSLRVGAEPVVALPFERDRVVVQGAFECVPASIYNVMQTMGRAMPSYGEFLRLVGDQPSARPGCTRFRAVPSLACDYAGTRNEDQAAMMRDAARRAGLDDPQSGFLSRWPGEREQPFIRRVHGEILASIRAGMPLVSRVLHYVGRNFYVQHAHMIFGVSQEPYLDRAKGWAFRMKIFEQGWGAGQVMEVLVHERVTPQPEPIVAQRIGTGDVLPFLSEWRVPRGWAAAFAEIEMRRADGGWQPLYAEEGDPGRLAPVLLELIFGRFDENNVTPAFPTEAVTAAIDKPND